MIPRPAGPAHRSRGPPEMRPGHTAAQNAPARYRLSPAGSSAIGLKADDANHLLFVCGGLTGTAHVYNSRTGVLVAQYQFAPNGTSLITANTVIRVTLSHDLSSGTITSTITSPLFDDPTTAAKYGDELALPNGRYDLGLLPPFGPGAPPGTTFNVIVAPAY